MLLMICGIVIGALVGMFALGEYYDDIGGRLAVGFVGACLGFIVALIINVAMIESVAKTCVEFQSVPLRALSDRRGSGGQYWLLGGRLDDRLYLAWIEEENGISSIHQAPADSVLLSERDDEEPHIVYRIERIKDRRWRRWLFTLGEDYCKPVLVVPPGSILNMTFEVDLK